MKSILKKACYIFCFFAITSLPLLAIENGIYAIKLTNNKALDADKDKFQINGNDVVVWDYWKGNNQLWKVENLGGNKHKITCLAGGKALSAWNDQVNNNGCRVTLWDYWGGESQHWIIENVGNESYSLKCAASNAKKVMDADPNKMNTNGSKMVLWDYWGGESQKWRFEKVNDYLGSSATTTIRLQDINESLCPKDVLQGDREFDGHGPKVQCQVDLRIGDEGRAIYADIFIRARETTHDWSTTERRWARKVYDAPAGKRIKSINSDRSSYTEFISGAAGFQILLPGADVAVAIGQIFEVVNIPRVKEILRDQFGINPEDAKKVGEIIKGFINNGNTVYQIPPVRGSAVRLFQIVGDTGGPDISEDDNCNDDTRIVKIEFNSVIVILE